jgi:ribosomal protein S18 acetylase RimI-like enzyme
MLKIAEMKIKDYADVYALWQSTKGIGLFNHSDSRQGIASYLKRNKGMSFVARSSDKLVGVILCGHDGRRGYIYHLAVNQEYRKKGIGTKLVTKAVKKLEQAGINRCHLFVFDDNKTGHTFWKKLGWTEFNGIKFMSKPIGKEDKIHQA